MCSPFLYLILFFSVLVLSFLKECCLCNLRGGALKTTTDNRLVPRVWADANSQITKITKNIKKILQYFPVLNLFSPNYSLLHQVGSCHLCYRRGWSSFHRCHWEGASGRQRRSRNPQESSKIRRRQIRELHVCLCCYVKWNRQRATLKYIQDCYLVSFWRKFMLLSVHCAL